jgi:Winged helix DNA-binding domain
MGWKRRDWFLSINHHHVFDRTGNIGPTLWWNGEIIGSWAITSTGELRTTVLADRGTAADTAVEVAAGRLQERLQGTVVTPAFRVPLERSLVGGADHP